MKSDDDDWRLMITDNYNWLQWQMTMTDGNELWEWRMTITDDFHWKKWLMTMTEDNDWWLITNDQWLMTNDW